MARVLLDKLNAFNDTMSGELVELCSRVHEDRDVRVVVLRGRGEHFMGGGGRAHGPPDQGRRAG